MADHLNISFNKGSSSLIYLILTIDIKTRLNICNLLLNYYNKAKILIIYRIYNSKVAHYRYIYHIHYAVYIIYIYLYMNFMKIKSLLDVLLHVSMLVQLYLVNC